MEERIYHLFLVVLLTTLVSIKIFSTRERHANENKAIIVTKHNAYVLKGEEEISVNKNTYMRRIPTWIQSYMFISWCSFCLHSNQDGKADANERQTWKQ
jgi:hypothetical protein